MTAPPILACPSDPAGAPSGLRWEESDSCWWLCGEHGQCHGSVREDILPGPPTWIAALWSSPLVWREVHRGTLADCARALVEEVRRA